MTQGFGQDIQKSSSRISQLKRKLDGSEDAELIMMSILEVFREVEYVPDVGNYYTFIYQAKTPNTDYDQHPLVAVTDIFPWGFRGINFHWDESRNYTWQEVAGALHRIYNNEISYLRSLDYRQVITK